MYKLKSAFSSLVVTALLTISPLNSEAHTDKECKSRDEIFCQITSNSPNLNKKYARKLSKIIRRASRRFSVPKRVLTAILMQESSYRLGIVRRECGVQKKDEAYTRACVSQDFGISQISYRTAKNYKFDLNRLTTDLDYSVSAGAEVLSWFYKTYGRREPDAWYSHYNCGTRSSKRRSCIRYIKDVGRWK